MFRLHQRSELLFYLADMMIFLGSSCHCCWCRAQYVRQSICKDTKLFFNCFILFNWALQSLSLWVDTSWQIVFLVWSHLPLGSLLCSVSHTNEWVPRSCYIGKFSFVFPSTSSNENDYLLLLAHFHFVSSISSLLQQRNLANILAHV